MELFGRELTTDEVIQFVRAEAPDARDLLGCHDCTILTAALTLADALEAERRAAPENKPLTLEQLRQMDGEPVWIKADHYGIYADIVNLIGKEDGENWVSFKINYRLRENGYGKTWLAYANRPEGT